MDKLQNTSLTLLAGLRSQDADAWWRLTELYGPTVYRWLRRLGLREADTPDVVQDVFQSVFVSIERFRKEKATDRFRDWLYTITKRRFFDHLRKSTGQPVAAGGTEGNLRMHDLPDPCADDSSILQTSDETEILRRALTLVEAEFEPRTWKACVLTAVEERSPAEVAGELGMSLGAVYIARSRVLKRIRAVLEGLL